MLLRCKKTVFVLSFMAMLAACASAPNDSAEHTQPKSTVVPTQTAHHANAPPQSSVSSQQTTAQLTNIPAKRRKLVYSADAISQEEMLVTTLLTKSSASRSIRASDNPRALSLFEKAKSYYDTALQAGGSGDALRKAQLLREAKVSFFQAARLAADNSIKETHSRDNYKNRMQSARALLAALRRIGKEKNSPAVYVDLLHSAERQLQQSRQTFAAGHARAAQAILDKAFLTVKESIIKLRNGDTLVRSLNFSSPEQEYRYELDRNDTHKLLLTVLFRGKNKKMTSDPKVRDNLDEAATLRRQAEQKAQAAQYKSATKLLEKATRLIIRAIRSAGVYIPG